MPCELSPAQVRRQQEREFGTGRYVKNPCSCCGKGAPMNYCSHGTWPDDALVLCDPCAMHLEPITDRAALHAEMDRIAATGKRAPKAPQ